MDKKERVQILVSAANELSSLIDSHNTSLRKQISPNDLDEPEYMDMQTCHELLVIASGLQAETVKQDANLSYKHYKE